MSPIYDMDEEPPTEEEMAEERRSAARSLGRAGKRAVYSSAALLLICAALYPFSKGRALHAYWEPVGVLLTYVFPVLFIAWVICVGLWIISWLYSRDLSKPH